MRINSFDFDHERKKEGRVGREEEGRQTCIFHVHQAKIICFHLRKDKLNDDYVLKVHGNKTNNKLSLINR